MGSLSWALSIIGAVWVSGCAVGPDFELPTVGVPKSFGTASLTSATDSPPRRPAADFVRWWQVLHDRQLNALIERAVASNPDLEIALTRVQEARTEQIVVLGAMLPKVNASAAAGLGTGTDLMEGRAAQALSAGSNTTGIKSVSRIAGFDAGWELDLFGKYQRLLEAVRDDAETQMELRNAVLITIIADVARNYLEIRALQLRLEIVRNDVATAQKTVNLLLTRFDSGMSNELDLTLARRQLATQQARLPELTAEISATESRLALLLGTYSADIVGELQRPERFPRISEHLRPGVPVDLLRRRPDIRAAERDLAAATARIGVAIADLFPSVALTAGFGLQGGTRVGSSAAQFKQAVPIRGPIWSAGPGAYWPLLDFGRLDALINIQEMKAHELLVNYRKTIIVAVEEVDQAIKQYQLDLAQHKALGVALAASRRSVDLSMERYESGVTNFLNVLDAQRQEYALEDQNAIAEEVVALEYVALYKALGGGWELYDELPPIPDAQPAVIAAVRRLLNGWH
jgi:NodT family efflux transporter outer membrane factor (OMF) lipoprotein